MMQFQHAIEWRLVPYMHSEHSFHFKETNNHISSLILCALWCIWEVPIALCCLSTCVSIIHSSHIGESGEYVSRAFLCLTRCHLVTLWPKWQLFWCRMTLCSLPCLRCGAVRSLHNSQRMKRRKKKMQTNQLHYGALRTPLDMRREHDMTICSWRCPLCLRCSTIQCVLDICANVVHVNSKS